jgi:tRNA A37 threonylcarbamoyladenosine modification protein TsaB
MINDKGDFYYLSTFENGLNELGTPLIDKVDSNFINRNIKEDSTIVVNNKESFEYINSIINDQVKLQYKPISSINMIDLSYESFKEKRFENLAYSEPLYVKKPYIT